MCGVTEKLGADLTETERTALMKIAAEMRCALTIITGATYVLTHSKQSKKASRFLRVLDEGIERLTRAVHAAEELAKTSQEGSVLVDMREGG
jgi:signal transduction histidine kinase